MVYEIEWTIQAIRQLKSIKEYIERDSIFYAEKFVNFIYDEIAKLGKYPEIGMVITEQDGLLIRRILTKSHRVIYCFNNDIVYIVAVSHQHQLYPDSFDYLKDYTE
jgi:toxin ParE1/3/4